MSKKNYYRSHSNPSYCRGIYRVQNSRPCCFRKNETYFYIKTGESLETVKQNLVSQK